jgi:hypothetical protein
VRGQLANVSTGRSFGPHAVIVVDVWRVLDLLVGRDEKIARCDEIWVVVVYRDNGRHEIWPLEIPKYG